MTIIGYGLWALYQGLLWVGEAYKRATGHGTR